MSNAITIVNTSVQLAPAPNTLQQTGAMISQGGTTLEPGTTSLLTSVASLADILAPPVALASITWSGSVVTATTATPHGWTDGDVVPIVIAEVSPTGYNGAFTGTVTGASTVTYPLASDPGAESVLGTIQLGSAAEIQQMNTTFWTQQGVFQAVYVLELGEGTVAEGVAALVAFMDANPKTIYSYLVPREWSTVSAFTDILENYDAPNAFTYFYVTPPNNNYSALASHKCVLAEVEAPNLPATEFSLAALWARTLNQRPSSTNKVPPLSYAFLYGVTPYPLPGNQTLLQTLRTANVGWVGTGAEGGLTNTIAFIGQMMDGLPWNFWYSADWAQLNIDLALSNEVINGSNTNVNPLYYNQQGINRLQNRALQVMNSAVAYGLAQGQVKSTQLPIDQFLQNYNAGMYVGQLVVNAEPFLPYSAENPTDYASGIYGGLTCVYTPLRGFLQIIFNLQVTDIIV